MSDVRDTQNLKQSSKPEDSISDKLHREVEVLLGGTKDGIAQSLKDAYNHPGSTLAKLGGSAAVGAGLVLLQGRSGMLKIGAEVAGAALGYSFLTDVTGRAGLTAGAISDTWRSAERLERNKQIVAKTAGPFLVDTALMGAGGLAGARVSKIPSVNRALYSGVDNLYSRVPSPVFLKENRELKLLDRYHPEYGQHTRRVGQFSSLIAEEMGLPRSSRVAIEHAGKMHDIGKLDVPLEVLNKHGPLNAGEREIINTHAEKSFERLTALGYPGRFADVPTYARNHHERIDGLGYSQGLKGEQIPLESRIVSVADTFDAITSARPYQQRKELIDVHEIMKSTSGQQLDPSALEALMRIRADKIARILESGPGLPKLPNLKPLKGVTLGDMLDPTRAAEVNPETKELFSKIYHRVFGPKR